MPLVVGTAPASWHETIFIPSWSLQVLFSTAIICLLQTERQAIDDLIDPFPEHRDYISFDFVPLGIALVVAFCILALLANLGEFLYYRAAPRGFGPGTYSAMNGVKAVLWVLVAWQFDILVYSERRDDIDLANDRTWLAMLSIEAAYLLGFLLPAVTSLSLWWRRRSAKRQWMLEHGSPEERMPLLE